MGTQGDPGREAHLRVVPVVAGDREVGFRETGDDRPRCDLFEVHGNRPPQLEANLVWRGNHLDAGVVPPPLLETLRGGLAGSLAQSSIDLAEPSGRRGGSAGSCCGP